MALNTNLTTSAGLSVGQPTQHYHRTMLAYAKPNLVHAQFAEKVSMPKHVGKTIQFRRWIPLATIITPLEEATVPDGQTVSEEEITATVYQYGGYIAISDMLDLTHIEARPTEMSELCGDQGGRTIDEVVRDVMAALSNVHYCGGKTAIYKLQPADKFTVTELRTVIRTLENANTPMFRKGGVEHYVAIVSPYSKFDLQSDTNWIDVKKYSDPKDIYSGEIGMLYGVRFVVTTLAKTYVNRDLIAGSKKLTITGTATSKTIPVAEAISDGEATALVGRKIALYDASASTEATKYPERFTVASAASGAAGAATVTVTENISTTLADGDILYANEYGQSGNTVHNTMIFGAKAYGMIDISGNSGNLRIIVKNKGEGGPSNPLEQFSTIGWKVEALACCLLQPLWIVKCLHGVTA